MYMMSQFQYFMKLCLLEIVGDMLYSIIHCHLKING